jgi:cation diffusion facilitator CzcD-associated flavoprotein CzcO
MSGCAFLRFDAGNDRWRGWAWLSTPGVLWSRRPSRGERMSPSPEHIALTAADREALRIRYRAERDKRLRADGNEQYLEPSGRYAHLLDDPFTPRVARPPRHDEVTVAFIGGGFAGLVTGARLKQAGIDDLLIIEGGGDFGGVWYWNRYPGAMCDTAAMVYLPLLEETGYMPSMKYTYATEIFAHARRIATTFDLYPHALFSTAVTELAWDEAASRWLIRTDRGDAIRARFVAMGTGPLHRPKLPGIPGIQSFAGHAFHTSRWDYAYTGGDAAGAPMDKLADKRVGIIGTGATAVQCIPPLARAAQALYVFQRTPSSIDVRNNHPIDPEWFKTLKPGWQHEWLMNFATLQTGGFADEDLVKDGWTDIAQRVRDRVVAEVGAGGMLDMATIQKAFEDSDDEKMTEIRARVDAIVRDPATAAALKPWYRQLCKRPCFHDEYLQAYNEPNVHLIDTDGKGVERIDATGAWVAGVHYEVDCLIFASGFEVGTSYARRAGFETTGRGGETLSARWADGMETLHGMHVHGFPNLFIVGMNQGANLISNITHNLTEAGTTVAAIIAHALRAGADQVEVTKAAEQAWVQLLESNPQTFLGNPDCTPGYYNNEGKPMGRRERLGMSGYPGGPVAYFNYIGEWRTSGRFEGLEFRIAEPSAAARSA